jgi:thiol-disulfide isomerase/thioredoxin
MNAHEIVIQTVHSSGISYQEYISELGLELETGDPASMLEHDAKYYGYKELNMKRMDRVESQYNPSHELLSIAKSITIPMTWMLITESWCGDSAHTLPYIARIAEALPNMDLRILSRDNHPDIMDLYLTNGTRSIPMLIAFDAEWNEIFRWGPRPEEAMVLAKSLKEETLSCAEKSREIQNWYNKNKGSSQEQEFMRIFDSLLKTA